MTSPALFGVSARDRRAMLAHKTLQAIDRRRPHALASFVDATQWWGEEPLAIWRRARLFELLDYAHKHVPFYRERIERAGGPAALAEEGGLSRLPVLTKQELANHGKDLTTRPIDKLMAGMTSGTTGTPVRVWHERDFVAWLRALQRRAFHWYGVDPTMPSFYFGGAPVTAYGRFRRRLLDLAISRRCEVCYDMTPKRLDAVIAQIRSFKPRVVTGFSSALYGLVRRAEETGTPLYDLGVKLVLPISEVTPPHFKEAYQRAFGAPVLNEYGCVEIGAHAFSCPSGRIHISHEHVVFEVVGPDGKPVKPGEVGSVVLTPLFLKGMPLLRYELGDLAVLEEGLCPCGRTPGLPLVKEVVGRSFDRMVDANGQAWHAFILYFMIKEVFDPKIFRELQGVQSTPGEMRILIVPGPAFDPKKADHLVESVKKQVPLNVRWELVTSIEREGSGKFKYFRSMLPGGNLVGEQAVR